MAHPAHYGGLVLKVEKQDSVLNRVRNLFPGDAKRIEGGMCRTLSSYWIINNALGKNHWDFLDGHQAPKLLRDTMAPEYEQREKALKMLWAKVPDGAKTAFRKAVGAKPQSGPDTFTGDQSKLLLGMLLDPSCKEPGPIHDALAKTGCKEAELKKLQPTKDEITALRRCLSVIRKSSSDEITKQAHLPLSSVEQAIKGPGDVTQRLCKDGYTFIAFTPGDNSNGHAMAAYACSGGGIYFHDPNCGDTWFPDLPKFQKFFIDHMRGVYDSKSKGSYKLELYKSGGPLPKSLSTERAKAIVKKAKVHLKKLPPPKPTAPKPQTKAASGSQN